MSDIVDGIKDFYDHFIMRDLLSFVTPGAIIVISILLLKYDFSHILDSSKSIPILVYIPIFGLFFMVGFAVQVFGAEILKIIQFHNLETDTESYEQLQEFMKATETDKAKRLMHERFVILKQMCGNCALAIAIGCIILIIRQPKYFPFIVWAFNAAIVLYVGHLVHVRRQDEWEKITIKLSNKIKRKK